MFSYAILGLLLQDTLSGYELKKEIEDGVGVFYRASFGSIYPALKALAEKGYIAQEGAGAGARGKKTYAITPAGRAHFLLWLCQPIKFEEETKGHLLKIYFYDRLPPEDRAIFLAEYEQASLEYLQGLIAKRDALETPENRRAHYYKLATLQYCIATARAAYDWCCRLRAGLPLEG